MMINSGRVTLHDENNEIDKLRRHQVRNSLSPIVHYDN